MLLPNSLEGKVFASVLGRVKGFEFRFLNSKRVVRSIRSDPKLTNVSELLEAVVAAMAIQGELIPEIEQIDGKPLVRRLVLHRQ